MSLDEFYDSDHSDTEEQLSNDQYTEYDLLEQTYDVCRQLQKYVDGWDLPFYNRTNHGLIQMIHNLLYYCYSNSNRCKIKKK